MYVCDASGALYTEEWLGFHCLDSNDKAFPGNFKKIQIMDKHVVWATVALYLSRKNIHR